MYQTLSSATRRSNEYLHATRWSLGFTCRCGNESTGGGQRALTVAGKLKSFAVCCRADDEVICLTDRGNRVGGEGGPNQA
jgi:hypothetical protein